MVPTLVLENVRVRNMLVDQQALIYVERDNIIYRKETNSEDIQIQHMGNYDFGGSIQIMRSAVHDCSFELGMINVPPVPTLRNEVLDHQFYSYQDNISSNYSEILTEVIPLIKKKEEIYIENSLFSNLNYGKATHSIRKRNQESLLQTSHNKGILLNIDQFDGPI